MGNYTRMLDTKFWSIGNTHEKLMWLRIGRVTVVSLYLRGHAHGETLVDCAVFYNELIIYDSRYYDVPSIDPKELRRSREFREAVRDTISEARRMILYAQKQYVLTGKRPPWVERRIDA